LCGTLLSRRMMLRSDTQCAVRVMIRLGGRGELGLLDGADIDLS
jgi:hypothetical protein